MVRGPTDNTPRRHRLQPKLPAADLTPPEWLAEKAREEWDRLAPDLREAGILSVADIATFASYCCIWAELVDLTAQIDAAKPPARAKLYALRSTTINRLTGLGRALGLSPRARSNLRGDEKPAPQANKFEAFVASP